MRGRVGGLLETSAGREDKEEEGRERGAKGEGERRRARAEEKRREKEEKSKRSRSRAPEQRYPSFVREHLLLSAMPLHQRAPLSLLLSLSFPLSIHISSII